MTCFNCNIGNISRFSSGTCDLRVPFELYALPNFPSVKRGHRVRRKSREQGIPFRSFDKGVECNRYTAFIFFCLLGFVFVCLNFEFPQQDFGIQSGNFASLVAYFFNVVGKVIKPFVLYNKDKNVLGKMEKHGNLSINDFKCPFLPLIAFSSGISLWMHLYNLALYHTSLEAESRSILRRSPVTASYI